MTLRLLIIALAALLLTGCDIPGMGPDPRIAQREADGRAIGGACRYSLRGIEDCYYLNEKASKTAIFAGWKDMDQYMRENKIEGQVAVFDKEDGSATDKKSTGAKDKVAEVKPKAMDKPAEKSAEKSKPPEKAGPEKTADKPAEKP